jgi:hypothetical protein
MKRHVVGPLIVGWLLGLLTAFVIPSLTVERQSYVSEDPAFAVSVLRARVVNGWVVTRTDTAGGVPVYQLERPRSRAVVDQIGMWLSDMASSLGIGPPRTPTPVPKPTEAPKPAQPAASPPAIPR